MLFRLKDYFFAFSLQVGVVFTCCFGLVLHATAFIKLCYDISPEKETRFIVASYVTASVFIIVGFVAYIVGLIGAALEETVLVKVSGWFLVFELIYWCVLTILSFTGKCSFIRGVCVDNRCAERLYIQNGYWRTPISDCRVDDDDGGGNDDNVNTDEPGTPHLYIWPVRGRRVHTGIEDSSTFAGTTMSTSGTSLPSGGSANGNQTSIKTILRPRHFSEEQQPFEEQIRILLSKLKMLIGNWSRVIEPNDDPLLRNVGRSVQIHGSPQSESRSIECANVKVSKLHGTIEPKEIEEDRTKVNGDDIKILEALNENTTLAHDNQTLNQTLLMKNVTGLENEGVREHEVNITAKTLEAPKARYRKYSKEKLGRRAKREMSTSAQLKQSQFIGTSYNGMYNNKIKGTWASGRRGHEYPKINWYELNQARRAIPEASLLNIFPRDVKQYTTDLAENNSTTQRMNLRGSSRGAHNVSSATNENRSVQTAAKANGSATGQRDISEFEPIDDDHYSKQKYDKLRQDEANRAKNKPRGRLSENNPPSVKPKGGNENHVRLRQGNATTTEDVNITTTSATDNSKITTMENGTTTATENGKTASTTENLNERAATALIVTYDEPEPKTPLGPQTPHPRPHFILSIVYACVVLIFWFIYPILVIFSFAVELTEEEEERGEI